MDIKPLQQSITCKNCGKIHTIDCYPIINLQSSTAEFIQQVFNLDLFKVKCDCGTETIVQYNTVIVDMYKKYIIYMFIAENKDIFYENIKPGLTKLFTENEQYKEVFNSLNNTRLVCSINDLLEKMLIYDYDLDDQIIECIKLSLLEDKRFIDKNISKIYFEKIDKSNLIFSALSSDENSQPQNVGIDIEYYNITLEKYKKYTNDNKPKEFELVDLNYIISVLEKSNIPTENSENNDNIDNKQ
jgi:hypothetical protein